MPQYQSEPPHQPRLRPQRLVPADAPLPGESAALSIEPILETWALEPGAALPPEIAEAGRALAQRAWLVIEKAALTLDAVPAILKAVDAPEETLEILKVIASVLLALPDQLAAGLDTSVARADRMFARLLNAPGQPGLIEQVMSALETAGIRGQEPTGYAAELEILRCLHRDLVTLQQEWDDLLDPLFPGEPALPVSHDLLPTDESLTESAGRGDETTSAPPSLPGMSAPLPEGLVVALPASARSRQSRYIRGQNLLRLALLLSLLLFAFGTGALLLRRSHAPTLNPGSAALAFSQQTPVMATAASQPTPPQVTPNATPSPPPPSSSRGPVSTPSPTASPTPGLSCWPGATFCASALSLQVPCTGQGSASFQLTNTTNQRQDWQTASSSGPAGKPLVNVTPSSGHLQPHQTITLTVQGNASGDDFNGTLTIFGPPNVLSVVIALAVCD